MVNPNDTTAEVYDFVNSPLKGKEITEAEVGLICKLVKPKAKILDIGCGTGRHAVRLLEKGYKLTCVDSSESMLSVLKSKTDKPEVLLSDINKLKLPVKNYDLIILMWNTFNEIALSEKAGESIFRKLKSWIKKNGKILINIDNPDNLNLSNLKFATHFEKDKKSYKQTWKVIDYDKKNNITLSEEVVTVRNFPGETFMRFKSLIKQRWWSREEIEKIAENFNLCVEIKKLKLNDEYYFVLEAGQGNAV